MSRHHPKDAEARPAAEHRLDTVAFTYKIVGQDGRRFWGTTLSQYATDRLIGSLSTSGKWIYIAAHQGLIDGEIIDNDTISMCYREASPSLAIVGCNEMKRQK